MASSGPFVVQLKSFVEEKLFLNDRTVVHTNQNYCAISQGIEEINACYYSMPCYLKEGL